MREFASLDRCAAYVAARATLIALQHVARDWPGALANRARRAALDAVDGTAEATGHPHGSAGRRRCLIDALASALGVAAALDAARAIGLDHHALDDTLRTAGRSVALLGMFLHANTSPIPDAA